MLTVTANEQSVDIYRGDIVRDTIVTSVGVVPFEWTTGFNKDDAIAAIEAFLDGEPLEVESTGEGWIINLESESHPQAEITDVDYMVGLINFRWRGSIYSGDCAVSMEFNLDTTPAQVAGAVAALIPG
ncbi:hypothetical protein [Pseudohongiella acticola]|uniref:hypothetical protein n=1 Tax=Pseudohongiella acticola TaxID=1524254 RepID=UPI0030EC0EA2